MKNYFLAFLLFVPLEAFASDNPFAIFYRTYKVVSIDCKASSGLTKAVSKCAQATTVKIYEEKGTTPLTTVIEFYNDNDLQIDSIYLFESNESSADGSNVFQRRIAYLKHNRSGLKGGLYQLFDFQKWGYMYNQNVLLRYKSGDSNPIVSLIISDTSLGWGSKPHIPSEEKNTYQLQITNN